MAYKGRLVEFLKKLGIKTGMPLVLGENKEGNTQGMCFFGRKIRDKNYQNSENNKGCF